VVLRYNYKLKQWSVHTYPSEYRVFAKYLVSGVNTIVGGDTDGTVFRMEKQGQYADSTTAIRWKLRTQNNNFGSNVVKEVLEKVVVRGLNITGIKLGFILNEDLDEGYVKIKTEGLWKTILSLFNITKTVKANTIAVQVEGENSSNRAYIRELEIPKVALYEDTFTT